VSTPDELPFYQGTLSDQAVQDLLGALDSLWAGDWDSYGYFWNQLAQQLSAFTLLGTLVQLVALCVEGIRDHDLWPQGTDQQVQDFYLQVCQQVPAPYGLDLDMLTVVMDVAVEAAYGEQSGWDTLAADPQDSASRLLSGLATLLPWVGAGLGLDPQQLAQEMAQSCPVLYPRET
jgi:hypothetical protein